MTEDSKTSLLHPAILHGHREDQHDFNHYLFKKPHLATMLFIIGALFFFSLVAIFFLSNSKPIRHQNTTQVYNTNQTQNEPQSTENWKTYTDDIYGFSFKYPSSYNLKKDSDTKSKGFFGDPVESIIISPADESLYFTYGITLFPLRNEPTIESWVNKYEQKSFNGNSIPLKDTTVAGLPAKSTTSSIIEEFFDVFATYVKKDNYIFEISYVTNKGANHKQIIQEYSQILSTFRFLDNNENPVTSSPSPEDSSKDLCGDGICQEVVCTAIGCPKPETPTTCPADCK